jgi:hypothetical protein
MPDYKNVLITMEQAKKICNDAMEGAQDIPGGGDAADMEAVGIIYSRVNRAFRKWLEEKGIV